MNIHTITVPAHFTDLLGLKPPKISSDRYAHRVRFQPIGAKGPGLFAKVPVPNEGKIKSLAVKLDGQDASGDLSVSIVDPTFYYDGYFLYTFLDNIPITTKGPILWRKTEIFDAAYSTNQGTQGFLYLLILGGPTGEIPADVAITVETD